MMLYQKARWKNTAQQNPPLLQHHMKEGNHALYYRKDFYSNYDDDGV